MNLRKKKKHLWIYSGIRMRRGMASCIKWDMPKKKKQTMRRISVYLTDEQCERLDQLSTTSGVPQAEIIRRCLDAGLSNLKVGLK